MSNPDKAQEIKEYDDALMKDDKVRMTASDLKYHVQQTGSNFFDRSSMKFFGDKMANYYVSANPVNITTSSGVKHTCWELTRVRPVKMGLQAPAYFDWTTYERVIEPIRG